jgi:hypothetical protein
MKSKKEKDFYVPFVDIANLVLGMCRDLEADGLKPAQIDDEELIFHVDDPSLLNDGYQSIDGASSIQSSDQKLGVIATQFAAV